MVGRSGEICGSIVNMDRALCTLVCSPCFASAGLKLSNCASILIRLCTGSEI